MLDEDGAFFDEWKGLDYGCGWGRFASVLLKKGLPEQLDLFDAWPRTLSLLETLGYSNRVELLDEVLDPLAITPNKYDLGLSFSVFTHLSPLAFERNLPVLTASLKPAGRFYFTVRHREFIDHKYADRAPELASELDSSGVVFLDSGGDLGSSKAFGDTIVSVDFLAQLTESYATLQYIGQPHDLQHVYRLIPLNRSGDE